MHPHTRSAAMGRSTSGLIFIPSKRFVSMAVHVLLALSSPTPTAANLFSAGAQPKRDVTLTIETSKTSFAADEPILIEVILKNNELKKPVRVLDWVVPCQDSEDVSSPDTPTEMSFFAINTAGGYVAKYLGAVFKRDKPAERNFKMLKPGDEISCTIDLGKFYEFASGSDDNSYEIKYSVTSMELSSPNASTGASVLESLESNTLTIKIDARNFPKRALRERKLQALNNFRNCDTSRQSLIVEARSRSINAANAVMGVIDSVGQVANSQNCPRYKDWFGNYDSNRHNELKAGYVISRDMLGSASITFDCGCTRNYYAYVYPDRPYEIFLCNLFWSAGMTGTDSKMGTIVHEMTHFFVTADTDDHAYGQPNCKNLALNNPGYAINNADNHEYIAENTPSLSCSTASTITIQAESYQNMFGVQKETTSDVGGGQNVGFIDTGDWMSYPVVTIPSAGAYKVEYRVASLSGGGSLQFEKAGGTPVYGRLGIPATGGWQNWRTVSHTVTLNAGSQFFGIKATGGGWNINWFRITKA